MLVPISKPTRSASVSSHECCCAGLISADSSTPVALETSFILRRGEAGQLSFLPEASDQTGMEKEKPVFYQCPLQTSLLS